MSHEWYCVQDGQQTGPFSAADLKQMAASGSLGAQGLVWKEGMAEWVPASRLKGLFPAQPAPAAGRAVGPAAAAAPRAAAAVAYPAAAAPLAAAPAASAGPGAVGYYSPAGQMSDRTAAVLRGYPHPAGPAHDWPLSGQHLADLARTESYRKEIRRAAGLYSGLCLLSIIGLALQVIGLIYASPYDLFSPGTARQVEQTVLIAYLALSAGFTVLYFIASQSTTRCRVWAPITMLVLFGLGMAGVLYTAVQVMSVPNAPPLAALPMLVVMLIVGAFAWISLRAMLSIPKFLAQPVWCQEALVNAKL